MEEIKAVKKVQQFQSGTVYVTINCKTRDSLKLKRGDELLEKFDHENNRIIFEVVNRLVRP